MALLTNPHPGFLSTGVWLCSFLCFPLCMWDWNKKKIIPPAKLTKSLQAVPLLARTISIFETLLLKKSSIHWISTLPASKEKNKRDLFLEIKTFVFRFKKRNSWNFLLRKKLSYSHRSFTACVNVRFCCLWHFPRTFLRGDDASPDVFQEIYF